MLNSSILKNYNMFVRQFDSLDLAALKHSQIIIKCDFKAAEKDVFYINRYIDKYDLKILDIKYSEKDNCSFFKLSHLEKNNLSSTIMEDYFNM